MINGRRNITCESDGIFNCQASIESNNKLDRSVLWIGALDHGAEDISRIAFRVIMVETRTNFVNHLQKGQTFTVLTDLFLLILNCLKKTLKD